MEKKQLDINNMNGITEEEDKTCGLNDMNCVCLLYTSDAADE